MTELQKAKAFLLSKGYHITKKESKTFNEAYLYLTETHQIYNLAKTYIK